MTFNEELTNKIFKIENLKTVQERVDKLMKLFFDAYQDMQVKFENSYETSYEEMNLFFKKLTQNILKDERSLIVAVITIRKISDEINNKIDLDKACGMWRI